MFPPRNAHGGHHGHRNAPFLPCTFPPTNARASSAGSGVQPLPRRWLCDPGSFSVAPRARPIPSWPEEIGLAKQTVGKWRARFIERRLDGLLDEPRPGGPRSITDTDVERVVTLTLETTPADATHWSTRSMAARTGLSQSAISRIWRAFALQPHRTETFKLSSDPLFIEKVRDIVGLYL